jgi:hypothetical protein
MIIRHVPKDYTLTMRDKAGRIVELYINADTINEMVDDDYPLYAVREDVESNAFARAIADGLIGEDAWVLSDFEASFLRSA